MTVQELLILLANQNPEAIVVLASDGEGNNYSPLSSVDYGNYLETSSWAGQFGLSELTPDLEREGYSEEDVVDGVEAIALYPVN